MKRRLAGLAETGQEARVSVPDGVYLVRVQGAPVGALVEMLAQRPA